MWTFFFIYHSNNHLQGYSNARGNMNTPRKTCSTNARQLEKRYSLRRKFTLPGFSFTLAWSPAKKQGFFVGLWDLQNVCASAFGRRGDLAELNGNEATRRRPRLAVRSRRRSASLLFAPYIWDPSMKADTKFTWICLKDKIIEILINVTTLARFLYHISCCP